MRSLGRTVGVPTAGLAAAAAVTLLTMMIATGAPGFRPLGAGAPLGDTLGDAGRGGSAAFAPLSPEILRDALGPGAVERLLGSPAEPISPISDLRDAAPDAPPEPPPAEQPPLHEQLTEEPDVRIEMSVDRSTVPPGGTVTYTLTVVNTGRGRANELRVSTHIPEHTRKVSDSRCGDDVLIHVDPSGNDVCLLPQVPAPGEHQIEHGTALGPGERTTYSFTVAVDEEAPQGTVIRNHAHVEGPEVPRETSNEVSTEVRS